MPRKKTHKEFEEELAKIFPNLELVSEYLSDKKDIYVRCKIHDYTFKTKPVRLRKGHGCQKCYDDRRGNSTRKSLEEVLNNAKEKHGDKYDYSLITEYKNNKQKLPIICQKHGVFYMDYLHHVVFGQGCPKCAGKHITTEDFIERAIEIHGDRYDYSKVNYINNSTKVIIKCNACNNEFKQTPDKHLQGHGCPLCRTSKMERMVEKFLKDNDINFIYQANKHNFDWIGLQSFDFYIPKLNLAIECQGYQHFKKSLFHDKRKTLEHRIELDFTKNNLCKDNGVNIIYLTTKDLLKETKKDTFSELYNENNIYVITDINNTDSKLYKILKGDVQYSS